MSEEQQTVQTMDTVKKRAWTDNYLVQAWLVLLMAALYGGILIAVQLNWGPIIAENKRQTTYSRIPDLAPGTDVKHVVEKKLTKDGKTITVYQCNNAENQPVGWVLPASGQGFADAVDLLIGLDAKAEKITGLFVLNQKETPGLGNYIKEDYFCKQFNQTNADKPITVVKGKDGAPENNEIRALTGATISSQSVCNIVNAALSAWRNELK